MRLTSLRKLNSDRPDKYAGINWIFKIEASISTLGNSINNPEISSFKRIEQPNQMEILLYRFPHIKIINKW